MLHCVVTNPLLGCDRLPRQCSLHAHPSHPTSRCCHHAAAGSPAWLTSHATLRPAGAVASYNSWTEVVQVVDVGAQLRSRGLPAKVCDVVLAGGEVPLVLSLMVGGVEHTPSEYQVGCWGCMLGAVCWGGLGCVLGTVCWYMLMVRTAHRACVLEIHHAGVRGCIGACGRLISRHACVRAGAAHGSGAAKGIPGQAQAQHASCQVHPWCQAPVLPGAIN